MWDLIPKFWQGVIVAAPLGAMAGFFLAAILPASKNRDDEF